MGGWHGFGVSAGILGDGFRAPGRRPEEALAGPTLSCHSTMVRRQAEPIKRKLEPTPRPEASHCLLLDLDRWGLFTDYSSAHARLPGASSPIDKTCSQYQNTNEMESNSMADTQYGTKAQ